MRFELKAIGQEGRVEALDLDAFDRDSAVKDAESRGYTVLSARSRARNGALTPAGRSNTSMSRLGISVGWL